jgi:hypothetical protein
MMFEEAGRENYREVTTSSASYYYVNNYVTKNVLRDITCIVRPTSR